MYAIFVRLHLTPQDGYCMRSFYTNILHNCVNSSAHGQPLALCVLSGGSQCLWKQDISALFTFLELEQRIRFTMMALRFVLAETYRQTFAGWGKHSCHNRESVGRTPNRRATRSQVLGLSSTLVARRCIPP